MPFNHEEFRRLIPRLAQHPRIGAETVQRYGDDADALLGALRAGRALDDDLDDEMEEWALNAFHAEARRVVGLAWDGTAPGGSGGAWVSECAGI
jgi:hypothetical protein